MKTYKFITTITYKQFFSDKVQDVCDYFEAETLDEARELYEAKKRRAIIFDIPSSERKNIIFALKDVSILS